jgi:alpha-glucosidase
MTNAVGRRLSVPLTFLEDGTYTATICADGVNADRWASDYALTESIVKKADSLSITMAPGGGYLVRLRKTK